MGALDTECGGNKLTHQTVANGHLLAARMVAFGEYSVDGTASAMKARDWKDATDLVAQPIAFPANLSGTQHASTEDLSPSMGAANPMAVAFQLNGDRSNPGVSVSEDRAFCIPANPMSDRGQAVATPMAYNIAPGKGELKDDIHVTDAHISKTIDASGSNPSMHQGGAAIVQTMAVRRLTPTECERLQGFPDGYTNIPWRKAPESPDGPRYKALGNSWAVPVVHWIGQRIQDQIK